ncbi:MAG: hypothetical protein HY320_15890 [Armatimonadetes bacterium]|nr:hypothetical protein [Armatimonadota bacterium]
MPSSNRERLIEDLVARNREVLRRRLPQDPSAPQTMDEIEQMTEEISQEMDREIDRIITERKEVPPENQARCSCGALARYRGPAERVITTRHGEVRLRRRYYYCPACCRGFAPLDEQLRLDGGATPESFRGGSGWHCSPLTSPLPRRARSWSA